jgi:hypothetical protein
MKNRIPGFVLLALLCHSAVFFADVPPASTRKPAVPYFMCSMEFQTLQTLVFSPQCAGMVRNPYADLLWNPAFICGQTQKSIYFDLNLGRGTSQLDLLPGASSYYTEDYTVVPRWYSQTSIGAMDANPHYNLAALIPFHPKWTLGLFNRVLFDYGPFRSALYWEEAQWEIAADKNYFGAEYELQRLEIDDNQQTIFGIQNEAILGYVLSKKFDLALRLGHYLYNRDGDLYDSKWGIYPHYTFGNLDDEALEINGHHIETGLGITYHIDDQTRIGLYGGWMIGSSSEETASLDTSDSWSEKDTDTKYYDEDHYELMSDNVYESDAIKPRFALTFERELNPNFIFRSFFSGTWANTDISASTASQDTNYGEHTYDYYRSGSYHFRKRTYHSGHEGNFNGSGEEQTNLWKWFASLIWTPGESWAAFGGIQIQYETFRQDFLEISDYRAHDWNKYTIYDPESDEYIYIHDKIYAFDSESKIWSAFIPVGIKAKIMKGFSLLVGTDVIMTLTDEKTDSKLLYPERITQKWENESLIVEDEETNRYEEYHSHPAKEFDRAIYHHFGLMYEHPNGVCVFFRSSGEVFDTSNWALGFSYNW